MNTAAPVADQGIGANAPPAEAKLSIRVDELIATANKWIEQVPQIKDEATANAGRDFLQQVMAEATAVEDERARQRKPLNDALKAIQAVLDPMAAKLDVAKKKLKAIIQTWIDAEKARLAREAQATKEAAARAEAEAAAALALAAAADAPVEQVVEAQQLQKAAVAATQVAATAAKAKPSVAGDVSGRALGERTTWSARIDDWDAALVNYSTHPDLRAKVQQLADADARSQKAALNIPGIVAVSKTGV